MYVSFQELRSPPPRKREGYADVDMAASITQLTQWLNALNLSNETLPALPNNPQAFTSQVSFVGGTTIDTSGNVIIGITPSLPQHAVTVGYLRPGSNIMNSLLGDTVTTTVLDFSLYATNTTVQNVVADGAMPLQNLTSIYGGGWRYTNNASAFPATINPATATSNKINWYFFSNSTQNVAYLYSRFRTAFVRLQFASSSAVQSGNLPYLAMYTLPLSSGGNGGSWYRSRKCYTIPSSTPLVNTDVVLYVGADPRECGFPNLNAAQYVKLTYQNATITFTGPAGQTDIQPSECLSLMGWGTNSVSTTGSIDITVVEMGYGVGSVMNKVITYY